MRLLPISRVQRTASATEPSVFRHLHSLLFEYQKAHTTGTTENYPLPSKMISAKAAP